jgi:CDP-glucose 4,6-dehydratase
VELPCREDHPLLGLLPYDASKACADILVRSFAHSYSLPVAVTRCANTYGPGDLNLSRIVPGTIVSVLRGEAPLIRSDGTPLRDFIYVDDSVAAYLTLAERIEETRGHAFNFGTAEPVQILDLVQRIIRIAGKEGQLMPRILAQSKVEGEIDAQYVSSEKAQACLGWTANVGLDEGLRRTIEWYKANLEQLSSRDQRVPALTSS